MRAGANGEYSAKGTNDGEEDIYELEYPMDSDPFFRFFLTQEASQDYCQRGNQCPGYDEEGGLTQDAVRSVKGFHIPEASALTNREE